MPTPRDNHSHQDDMNWLYGSSESSRTTGSRRADDENGAGRHRNTRRPRGGETRGGRYATDSRPRTDDPVRRGDTDSHDTFRTDQRRRRRDADTRSGGTRPARSRFRSGTATVASRSAQSAHSPSSHRRKATPTRHKHSFAKKITTLLVLWIIWLVGVPAYALLEGQKVDATPSGERPAPQPGTAVLLVGTDQRDNLTEKQQKQLGTGTAEGTRTDTMLLLYRPPKGRTILVSLPRDSYVPIPGHGRNKLNAAYAIGGAPLLTETVEQVTGVRLDGYMEIGFGGFVNMVDAVGGADVCLDKHMKDRDSHTDLPAGCQNLDGISALGYVRMRKADPLGDLGRVKRQQEVASQVAHKAMSPWTFINPVRYWKVVNAGASTVRRGEDTSLKTSVVTARSLMRLSGPDGMKLTVPVANANAQTAAGSSVLWDRERALQLFEMMKTGDTSNADSFR